MELLRTGEMVLLQTSDDTDLLDTDSTTNKTLGLDAGRCLCDRYDSPRCGSTGPRRKRVLDSLLKWGRTDKTP